MKRGRVFRFEVADRDALARLADAELPGVTDETTRLVSFRDVYYDSPAADLREKGATVRLRIGADGRCLLSVDVLQPGAQGRVARRRARQVVRDAPAPALFAGASEPARLLRALIDPARLGVTFEIETVRRRRTGRLGADQPFPFSLACDLLTVRRGELGGDFFAAGLRIPDDRSSSPVALELLRTLRRVHGLRPALSDAAGRARQLLESLEVDAAASALRVAREVAVVPHRAGEVGVLRGDAGIFVATGPGVGPHACRQVLRRIFGHGQGRLRLLGTSPGLTQRPALDVWLAEALPDAAPGTAGLVWIPLEQLIANAGAPGLRDARTLGALGVVARAALSHTSVPASGDGVHPRVEPIESLLRRLEQAEPAGPRPKDMPDELLFNTELSRLAFDERMLNISEDAATPLLERVRFLAMFGARRDDFFATRVARFKAAVAQGREGRTPDGLSPAAQLDAIGIRARSVMRRAYSLLRESLIPALETHGIRLVRWSELNDREREGLHATFGTRLEALLTPIVADPAHPFPHVRNLRPALAAIVRLPSDPAEHLVAVEFPGDLPRFLPLSESGCYVCVEDMIEAELPRLYPGLELVRAHTFRATRSAQIALDPDAPDVLRAVEHEVRRRPFGEVVRLEVEEGMPAAMRARLLWELQYEIEDRVVTLDEGDVYATDRLVDLAALEELADLDRPALKWPPLERAPAFDAGASIFDAIRARERLVHFPWQSFEDSVERLLAEAAEDEGVVSIKAALYRTARDSAIVGALRRAREKGKEAVVLVELKASFDEQRNIEWARELEDAGIRVVFSSLRYKVHAKIALVVRREGDQLRRYVYIGTGNLNATTAASYIDLGLLSAEPELAAEVAGVFNLLTGYAVETEWRRLLVAPFNMRRRFLEMIAREAAHARAGRPSGIRVQLNGLADRRIVAALYDASGAGVPIRLTVREICALRPGLPGVSENIEVRSVLGRFLQHARIFHFVNGGDDEYYIGSADWRPRNLAERIEVVTPIADAEHRATLDRILTETFEDPGAWRLGADGVYLREAESSEPILAARVASGAD